MIKDYENPTAVVHVPLPYNTQDISGIPLPDEEIE